MNADLLLLILSSPSGAGKTTLTQRLRREDETIAFSVSHTTRAPRANEVDGQDYHFTNRESFEAMAEEGRFAEWAEVHGNLYGTSVDELERARREGKRTLLFDVDYQGARQIKAKFSEAVAVFILPPSLEELHRRLVTRGTDDAATIERRFAKAKIEIEQYGFFDYLLVNDELQLALARLIGIVHAEQTRRWRIAPFAERFLSS